MIVQKNDIFLLNSKIIGQNTEIQTLKARIELLETQNRTLRGICSSNVIKPEGSLYVLTS